MAKKAKSQEESGVLRQYEQMKAKHPEAILLFRIGDFYETLREDAHKAKEILNLTVSSGKINGVFLFSNILTQFPKNYIIKDWFYIQ